MGNIRTEVRAERVKYRSAIELSVFRRRPDDRIDVAQPLVMRTVEDGEANVEPTMTLSVTEAQLLMDELWNCGLRPSEGTGSAGSLAATERHLKDMQAIAMGLLRKDGVQA